MSTSQAIFSELWTNYMKCPYDYPFDLTQEPDRFGYFEVLMDSDGNIYEAPNGHTRGVVCMIARDMNISPAEVDDISLEHVADYQEWLLETSGALMIWHNFYMGQPNAIQEQSIQMLKEKGFMDKNAFNRR